MIPSINLEEYSYILPPERIAAYPLANREESKLLFADSRTGAIRHYNFFDLPKLLPNDSLLIINNSKVISARLNFTKPSGRKIEILLVEPLYPSTVPQLVMECRGTCVWKCIIGGRRVRKGDEFVLIAEHSSGTFLNGKHIENKQSEDNPLNPPLIRGVSGLLKNYNTQFGLKADDFELSAKILKRWENEAEVLFTWQPENLYFAEILNLAGKVPLPPYIKREAEASDKERYQTVYAKFDGSVAAPTAGLHFTPKLLSEIRSKGIEIAEVALHVGPGTFLPIDKDDITHHEMHEEQFSVSREVLKSILKALKGKRKIIATGTTTLRTIESLYWLGAGLMLKLKSSDNDYFVDQWEPYTLAADYSLPEPEKAISCLMENSPDFINCRTRLLIVPGYDFKLTHGLITNFHIPKSTLILLVAAFLGKDFWRKVYGEALENDYRFLSYGDSSILVR